MKRICYILSILLVIPLASCTVKENRDECPCFLGVIIPGRQDMYPSGKAWVEVYNNEGAVIGQNKVWNVDKRDTTLWYEISPRQNVSVFVTNNEMTDGAVTVPKGEEYCSLYAVCKDVSCVGEKVTITVSELQKQFCNLVIRLSEWSLPYAELLTVKVEAPYNGTIFPAMKACLGDYLYRTVFDAEGKAVIRLPRQGGEGMKLTLENPGEFSSHINLYEIMRQAHYNWTTEELKDFEITVAVESVMTGFSIVDWSYVDYGSREF